MHLIIDRGGTKWIEEFSREHKMNPLPQSLKSSGVIAGVCDYYETLFGVEQDLLKKKELPLIDEYRGHPRIVRFFPDAYQTITL